MGCATFISRQKILEIWLLLGNRLVLDTCALERRGNRCCQLLPVAAAHVSFMRKRQMNTHTTWQQDAESSYPPIGDCNRPIITEGQEPATIM